MAPEGEVPTVPPVAADALGLLEEGFRRAAQTQKKACSSFLDLKRKPTAGCDYSGRWMAIEY